MRARKTAVAAAIVLAVLGTSAGFLGSAGATPAPVGGVECDEVQPDSDLSASSEFSTETIDDYDIDIVIDEQGTATFKESITYTFFGSKHGIFRDIITRQRCTADYDRVYPIEVLSVDSDTAPAQFTTERPTPASIDPTELINVLVNGSPIHQLKIGDPDRTITGTHTYEIAYRLEGVVNGFDDHDEFYWNVIGNGWAVNIRNVDVTVRTPAGVTEASCYAGPTGSRSSCTSAEVVDGAGHYTQAALGPHQNLTVLASFPAGTVENPAALLDDRWSLAGALDPATEVLVVAILTTVAIVVGWGILAFRVGRDRQLAGSHVDVAFAPVGSEGAPVPLFADDHAPVEFVPPDGIRPGQVGLLVDEVAHPVDVTATLVDLAVRGYVRIDEVERRWRRDDYQITRLEKDSSSLLHYERLLLDQLVSHPGQQRTLSELKNTFAEEFQKVVDALYTDGVNKGWFHGRPDKVRGRWKAFGIVLLSISIPLFVIALLYSRLAVLVVPLFVGGLVLAIGSRFMPRRTPAGTGLLRRVRGFEEFIRDSEAPRAQWAENRNIFSEYLPYAIVFRCADKWAKTFEDLGAEALGDTGWYHGDSFSAMYVASSMSSFSSSASSTLTSSPASSGSGSGGGGSSGGGGGGGGGGSW
jgi:uncharacterized membrane protein YgcG